MRQRYSLLILAIASLFASALTGCSTKYHSKEESLTMTPAQARKALRKTLIPAIVANGYRANRDAKKIRINYSTIHVTHRNDEVTEVPLRELSPSARLDPNIHGAHWYLFLRDRSHPILARGSLSTNIVHGFVDALNILKRDAVRREEELSKSDAAASPAKPSETDESFRRLKAQAEGALREKDFEGAADYYDLALTAAPGWAEGRFNYALILAENGDHRLAINQMKKYLLLVPDAPDAEKVRTKIYDWERKLD